MACGDQRPCGIEQWRSRDAQDVVVTIEVGLEASGTAWGRGDDERKR